VIHAEVSRANFAVLLAILRQILHFRGDEGGRSAMRPLPAKYRANDVCCRIAIVSASPLLGNVGRNA
jgi:hypothetical protein